MAKEGSTISGLMDAFATAVSVALQYGVPLRDLVNKFSHLRFEPAGFTTNPDVPMAKSLIDYIFRYLATKFLSRDEQDVVGVINRQVTLADAPAARGEGPADAATAEATAAPAPASGSEAAPAAEPTEEKPTGLLDGLEIVARNGGAHEERTERLEAGQAPVIFDTADSPACSECGSIMVRNGSCYKCINCGSTSGCS
jgi:ribonucleoside-diphosphate reductase alpha chain